MSDIDTVANVAAEGKGLKTVSGIFYILGVVTMLPWNFFITADTFWQYKLRNTTLGDDWDAEGVQLTDMQLSFTPTLVIVSNLSMLLSSFVTSIIVPRTTEKSRMYSSLLGCLGAMAAVTAFSIVNTDEWQATFYGLTMTMIALLNVGIAIMQGSLYGLAGFFPAKCMAALISGQALAGIVSSLSRIISLAAGEEDPVVSGIIYFVMADVFILISMGAYYYLTKMPIYNDVKRMLLIQARKKELLNKDYLGKIDYKLYWKTFLKIKWMGLTLGFVLLTTLAVFPAVTVYVTSSLPPSSWSDVYFQPTITFLLFNIFDMAGREFSTIISWPGHEGWLLHVMSALRVVFIPLLLLCNGDNKTFATLFHKDFYYIIINIFFAFSNGYYGALAMIYYPRLVEEGEVELAGSLMVALMGIGCVIGSALSPAFVVLWGPND